MKRGLVALALGALWIPVSASPEPPPEPFALAPLVEAFVLEQIGDAPTSVRIPPLPYFELPGVAADAVDVELRLDGRREFAGSVPITAILRLDRAVVRRGVADLRNRSTAQRQTPS